MAETLLEGLAAAQISVTPQAAEKMDVYCQLLWQWNERLNLTRHTDYATFCSRDVWDSVQLAECLTPGETVLDVGSGGGVPGILVSILRPDIRMTLSESVQKKAAALSDILAALDLPISVIAARAEDILPDMPFQTLVARAVGPMAKMLPWFQPHWDSIGRLLLIKGPRWVDERKEARHRGLLRQLELRRLKSYPMLGTDSESVILSISPGTNFDTPATPDDARETRIPSARVTRPNKKRP